MQQQNLRETLSARRDAIGAAFLESRDSSAVNRSLTELVEDVLSQLLQKCLANRSEADRKKIQTSLALVAIGGFARGELCPYSDVDLAILHPEKPSQFLDTFIGEFVREIWDVGLSLGQNVGSPKQLVQLAKTEVLPATSFLDARYLLGSNDLFESFHSKYYKYLRSGGAIDVFKRAVDAVREDQVKYGDTIHVLEPNIKRTAGGLRDIHLVRWTAIAVHNTHDLTALEAQGDIGAGDAAAIADANKFLLQVRCDMHFHAGKSHDDLLRSDQVRLARDWGYQDDPGMLAVERFMADYFHHASAVCDVVERFVERTRPRTLMSGARDYFLSRKVGDGIVLGPDRLILASRRRREVAQSLEQIIDLADLSAKHRVKFDYKLTETLRKHNLFPSADASPAEVAAPLSDQAVARFLQFLSRPGTQNQILRVLHKVGVLSRIIPEFEHARNLLQFNAYHRYTVDEHTFMVLQHLESFADRDDVVGRAYAAVDRKDLLHLAVLLHDLGKGMTEDHSEVGYRLAKKTGERFGLSADDTDTLAFLVHRHLLLSDLAQKRDINDPKVWLRLAREVRDIARLRMLYVLTTADIMGVGPNVYTQWTAELLEDLYRNTLSLLGDDKDAWNSVERWEKRRQEVLKRHEGEASMEAIVVSLPTSYLAEVEPEDIEEHLQLAKDLGSEGFRIATKYRPETKTTSYTVITNEHTSESVFSKICGGLAAHHLDVLSARIYTLTEGMIIDQFDVRDPHYFGDPTADRVKKVANTIHKILTGELSVEDALWSTRSSVFGAKPRVLAPVDTRVTLDNSNSETCSIIDVFTNNRRGLLYTLAKAIARCKLNLLYAKIATYEDEAADIFYVQEMNGGKVQETNRIHWIEDELSRDIAALVNNPRAMGF